MAEGAAQCGIAWTPHENVQSRRGGVSYVDIKLYHKKRVSMQFWTLVMRLAESFHGLLVAAIARGPLAGLWSEGQGINVVTTPPPDLAQVHSAVQAQTGLCG